WDLALVEERDDLLLDRVADALQLGRAAGQRELPDRRGAVGDRPGRVLVGEDPEAVGAIELVEGAELAERCGDLGVAHAPNLVCGDGRRVGGPPGHDPAARRSRARQGWGR